MRETFCSETRVDGQSSCIPVPVRYYNVYQVPRLMRVDNEEDEEEDMDVEIVSTSQYAGVRTRKGKVLVWSALGDNTLILKRDLCFAAGDVLMLSSCSSGFHFAMMVKKKEEVEEGDNKEGRNLKF